jgi:cytoskeleton protein RodZ
VDIGADLRNARIAQHRSIEDISRSTKISSSVLRAIESGEFHKVPGGVFTRGYIRAYAREVGLNPEEIVARYRAEFEPPPSAPADDDAGGAELPRIQFAPDENNALSKYRSAIELGVIAAIAAVCFGFLLRSSKPTATTDTALAPPPAIQAQQDKSVATTGSTDAVASEIKIAMRATGPCWIEATAGARRVARLMNEGDTETVTVREDVTLRVGEPSALAFSIEGVPGRPLGPGGKPVTVHISPQNYRDFLAHR